MHTYTIDLFSLALWHTHTRTRAHTDAHAALLPLTFFNDRVVEDAQGWSFLHSLCQTDRQSLSFIHRPQSHHTLTHRDTHRDIQLVSLRPKQDGRSNIYFPLTAHMSTINIEVNNKSKFDLVQVVLCNRESKWVEVVTHKAVYISV